ncbi:hypothetical protein [Mycobacterium sp.]|uniref:hypothetical protein n=1 Tax=Mycobacterium sp. TaxID=1785 RepID=UPI003D1203A1
MSNGDSDFPPDAPAGKCSVEHENAVSKYFDMKRAETDAIDAAKAAKSAALVAMAPCAVGAVTGLLGAGACLASVATVVAALEVARSKNDLFGVAIQQYRAVEQTLLDCISAAQIVVDPQ